MHIGNGVERFNHRRETLRPRLYASLAGDEILAHLDQHMRKSVDNGVTVHGVAMQSAIIGFIVTDHQRRIGPQHFDKRQWRARIIVPQDASVPGPRSTLHRRCE